MTVPQYEIAVVVVGYLLGSFPSALLLVRAVAGRDVRRAGSGNIGATNALRTAGWKVGVAVTVIDVAKGAVPMVAMVLLNPESLWLGATLLAAVLGHCFPVWLRFRGGKGVATGLGAFLVLSPSTSLAAIGVWFLVLLLGRWVSLASLIATVSFPLLLVVIDPPSPLLLAAVSIAAVVIIARHVRNIRRLIAGREPRIGDAEEEDR